MTPALVGAVIAVGFWLAIALLVAVYLFPAVLDDRRERRDLERAWLLAERNPEHERRTA